MPYIYIGFPRHDIDTVDVAILCVPSWRNVKGYPKQFIQRLKPKVIIPSHYDDFFEPASTSTVPLGDMEGFLAQVKRSIKYKRYQKLIVPKPGATIKIN